MKGTSFISFLTGQKMHCTFILGVISR